MRAIAVAIVVSTFAAGVARAGEPGEAEFQAAEQAAARGDAGAAGELEQVGAQFPASRWADDAWLEAGRLAARGGDYARARRDLERALAVTTDDQLARRARAELDRLSAVAGAQGQWAAVAAEHERLEAALEARGDPKPALAGLEALVEQHAAYPRAWAAMIEIAHGWLRDGNTARALGWLRRAQAAAPAGADRDHASAELVRALIVAGELDDAREQIAKLGPTPLAGELRGQLSRMQRRRDLRWAVIAMLAGIAVAAAIALRRAAGSWRAAARRLVRPPGEVVFYVPIAIVLVVVAASGNPLVAAAVRAIAIAGVAVGWLSGAILDAIRARGGRVGLGRAAGHAAIAALAVAGAVFLAIDHGRVIDLVVETWREGPVMR